MNERIKELMKQAGIFPVYQHRDAEGYWYETANYEAEKFAELIVAECIDKCEFVANMATITNTGEMARKTKATADSCATMIKQRFGVLE